MRIAVLGAGVSGLVSAWLLHREHEVTVYEAGSYPGGHSNTVTAKQAGRTYHVDTGFIVYNEACYPNFVRLLDQLDVATQPSDMSFSVQCAQQGVEYSSSGLNGLFAQRQNLMRLSFLLMVRDILRFYRHARGALHDYAPDRTLQAFVRENGYGHAFREWYLVPMLAAIWSADPRRVFDFPAQHFLRFFDNHGLLDGFGKIQWRTILGGSREYVRRLCAPLGDGLRLRTPVERVQRDATGVTVKAAHGESERFDAVVFATHSDQALRILGDDATDAEREILGAIPYQRNEAVLHTDTRMLPRAQRAWASWNYYVPREAGSQAVLTYNMNRLQRLDAPEPFLVTLNQTDVIAPETVLGRYTYEHPVFSAGALAAQQRHAEISGHHARTHFCGAYWGYGFHEDGVRSALTVARAFGLAL